MTLQRFLVLSGLFLTSVISAQAQSTAFDKPWKESVFQGALSSQHTYPKISEGYLISFERTIGEDSQGQAIYLNALTGGQQVRVPFWIPGAVTIWLEDVSMDPSNILLVTGSYVST
ncbi:MAG: hypothetical protein WBE47_15675, partial [Candidatus Acidiferrales bacterium]